MRPSSMIAIRLSIVVLVGALVTACAGTTTPTPAPTLTTGVRGHVIIDGGCPVIRPDSPCPDKPYRARVIVFPSGSDAGIAEVTSAPDGSFSIALQPGAYTVRGENLTGAVMPQAGPVDVTVPGQGYIEITVRFDSGIR